MTSPSKPLGFRCRCGKAIIFECDARLLDFMYCKCGLDHTERARYLSEKYIKLYKLALDNEEEYPIRWQFMEFIFELLSPHKLFEEDKK